MTTRNRSKHWIGLGCLLLGMLLPGCGEQKSASTSIDSAQPSGGSVSRPLSLLAIGVPGFGDEIARQWSAKRDGVLSIEHMSMADFENLRREEGKLELGAEFDLVVFPASINADLYAADLIREIPKEVVDNDVFNRNGILRHFRRAFVRHNNQVRSICLGGSSPVLLYRKDILKKLDVKPPETWEELARVFDKVEQAKGGFEGIESVFLMPTGEGTAAKMFLARSASEIRSLGKLTTFFDRRTVKPLLDQAPFVRALKDLKALASESIASGEELSSEEVFRRFAQGRSVFALGRPIAATPLSDQEIEGSATWGVMNLPGSKEFFDFKDSKWKPRQPGEKYAVHSLDFDVFNIGVSTRSALATDSFDFAIWLVEKKISSTILPSLTGPFRASHLGRIDRWLKLEDVDRDFQESLSDWNRAMHEEKVVLLFPQILRRSEYVGVLDEKVAGWLEGSGEDPGAALKEVADQWERLTDEVGREAQRNELANTSGL